MSTKKTANLPEEGDELVPGEDAATKLVPVQNPKAAKKKPIEKPQQYIFRFLKPPDKHLITSAKAGATYLKHTDNILWAHWIKEDEKTGETIFVPVSIYQDDIDVKALELAGKITFQLRTIRYIATDKSIFADEQEKARPGLYETDATGRNRIIDNNRNRDDLVFARFEKTVPASQTQLVQYLHCINQCINQHPYARRYGNTPAIYQLLDFGQMDERKVELGAARRRVYELARTARKEEMLPHAEFLGIAFEIPESGQKRDIEVIREDYMDYAYKNPKHFEDTFSDPKIKLLYIINALITKGEIAIGKFVPGQANWMRTRDVICQIPADESPAEHLAKFCLVPAGEKFAGQLKMINITTTTA